MIEQKPGEEDFDFIVRRAYYAKLEAFIDWLRKKDDVFYAFENTDEAITEFLDGQQNDTGTNQREQ